MLLDFQELFIMEVLFHIPYSFTVQGSLGNEPKVKRKRHYSLQKKYANSRDEVL